MSHLGTDKQSPIHEPGPKTQGKTKEADATAEVPLVEACGDLPLD